MREFDTAGAPHWVAQSSVQRVMRDVLLALLPGIAAHAWWFGPGIVVQVAIATAFALGFEAAMLAARRQPLRPFMTDLSAPVTAWLFALSIPPLAPWWVTLVGIGTALVVAKHLYGGLGYNLFNPAMVGYVVVLIAFPLELTRWLPLREAGASFDWAGALATIFGTGGADAIAQATPLDHARELARSGRMLGEIRADPRFGAFGGAGWEWIAAAYASGGAYLLARRVIHWHVPVAVIGTVFALTVPFWLVDPDRHADPLHHLFTGALMLGAFFIATDPVTGSATPRGRLVFGAGVAALTLAIRTWGAYPDGVAFAVLLMNATVPLLDRYTRPRVFGT